MTYKRREIIGPHTLYLGDCREILPTLGKVDAVVTDPPYGINYQRGLGGKGAWQNRPNDNIAIHGDAVPFDPARWLEWPCILWGANHYAQRLPHGRWLAWNKLGSLEPWDDFCDVEFAWHSARGADRIFSLMWKGICTAKSEGQTVVRYHPTQKPVQLMEWCISFVPDAKIVLDPYCGSGTTIVACQKLGRIGIGIEIDEKYFDIACKRVEEAMRQPDLFVETSKPAEQLSLLEAS